MSGKEFSLQEEVRNEFTVSEKRKRVWFKELECLKLFRNICEKYSLTWFVIGGTLLGAIRHGGFIPWDDDLDVAMPRADYEKFLSIASKELRPPFYLQTADSDKEFYCGFSRIRNAETTALIRNQWTEKSKAINGIFLDIFPFDNVPDSTSIMRHHKRIGKTLSVICNSNMMDLSMRPKGGRIVSFVTWWIWVISKGINAVISPERMSKKRDKWITKYDSTNTRREGMISMFYDQDRWIYECEDFSKFVEMPFENTTVIVPVNYHKVLKHCYGDWEKPVKGFSCHEGAFFDPDKPYTYYIKRYKKFKNATSKL